MTNAKVPSHTVELCSKGPSRKKNLLMRKTISGLISSYFYISFKKFPTYGENWANPMKSLEAKFLCTWISFFWAAAPVGTKSCRMGRFSVRSFVRPLAGRQSPSAGPQSPPVGSQSPPAGLQSPPAGPQSPPAGPQTASSWPSDASSWPSDTSSWPSDTSSWPSDPSSWPSNPSGWVSNFTC